MRLTGLFFTVVAVLGWASPASAAFITVQFEDIYASGGVVISESNVSHEFAHTIISPSEAPPSYNAATDTLTTAELVLTFANSTNGNDAIIVTWSNFVGSDSDTSGVITGGPGFPSPLEFDIDISLLETQGILNVVLTKGNNNPGSNWTFLTSTLTVDARRFVEDETVPTAPEPSMLALLGVGLVGAAARRRRRNA